jgi:hypothetical protein
MPKIQAFVDVKNTWHGKNQKECQEWRRGTESKVKAWLEKPEQKELLKSIQAMISPVMRPERQEQAVVTQAKNFIRNTGIKLS